MKNVKKQDELFNVAIGKEKVACEKGVEVYKKLVFYRFFEVVSHAYPIWNSLVDVKRLEDAIAQFMQKGSRTPLIWKFPNEFRRFIKKQKLFEDMPYVHDLLWFEWIEIELFMKEYAKEKQAVFSYSKHYKLGNNVVLKKLSYKVYERDFEHKGRYFVMAYYDIKKQEVIYREISELLYIFLKELRKSGLERALLHVKNLSGESMKSVKSFFKTTLQELYDLAIIRRIR
jgi:hypothetical protein